MRQQAARSRSDVVVVVVVVVVLPAEEAAALSEAAMQAARAEHLSAVTPRTIVAGQNSSGVALPKRQPKRADFCPISPATILPPVAKCRAAAPAWGG